MLDFASDGRPLPKPTPITQPFFDAAREHRLTLQRCPRDGFFFYPRSHCPRCLGTDWKWETVSGHGTVYAFTVDRIAHDSSFKERIPFAIAVIELDEGPRMTANIVACDVGDIRVGMPVQVAFEDVDSTTLIHFHPTAAG